MSLASLEPICPSRHPGRNLSLWCTFSRLAKPRWPRMSSEWCKCIRCRRCVLINPHILASSVQPDGPRMVQHCCIGAIEAQISWQHHFCSCENERQSICSSIQTCSVTISVFAVILFVQQGSLEWWPHMPIRVCSTKSGSSINLGDVQSFNACWGWGFARRASHLRVPLGQELWCIALHFAYSERTISKRST